MLRLVKNGAIKVEFLVVFNIPAQYAVRCDKKIRIRHVLERLLAAALLTGEDAHAQVRRETGRFLQPVVDKRRGRYNQRRPCFALFLGVLQKSQHLQRFTESHVVRQNAA